MQGRELTFAFILEGKNNYQLWSQAEVEIWEAAELGLYLTDTLALAKFLEISRNKSFVGSKEQMLDRLTFLA